MILKKYKYFFINAIIIICLIIGVKNTNYDQPEMVNMQELAEYFFSDYNYEYRVTSSKKGSVLATITIEKKDMPLNNFSNIEKKLYEKKWVLKRKYNELYTFCYGKKNRLNILYPSPNQKEIELPFGDSQKIRNPNNWLIDFYYRENDVPECY